MLHQPPGTAHAHGKAGEVRQPAVVVPSAPAQAVALPVHHQVGDEGGGDLSLGDDGAGKAPLLPSVLCSKRETWGGNIMEWFTPVQ